MEERGKSPKATSVDVVCGEAFFLCNFRLERALPRCYRPGETENSNYVDSGTSAAAVRSSSGEHRLCQMGVARGLPIFSCRGL